MKSRVEKVGHHIELEYSIKNLSDTNLILYLSTDKIFHFPSLRIAALCDQEKTGAGLVFAIFDKNLKWQSAKHKIISDYSRLMTKERADSAMAAANAESLKATMILKENEVKVFKQKIDISAFNLSKGSYLIKLIYYAGQKINHFANQNQQAIDMKAYRARVYQGCANSEKALLRTELIHRNGKKILVHLLLLGEKALRNSEEKWYSAFFKLDLPLLGVLRIIG